MLHYFQMGPKDNLSGGGADSDLVFQGGGADRSQCVSLVVEHVCLIPRRDSNKALSSEDV